MVVCRVKKAGLTTKAGYRVKIGTGLVVLVGFEGKDKDLTRKQMSKVVDKVVGLRIFNDDRGKMNKNLKQIGGSLLLVPQFTLFARTNKGYRPFFGAALEPEPAKDRFRELSDEFQKVLGEKVKPGWFGAYMRIQTEMDGPVTIIMDF